MDGLQIKFIATAVVLGFAVVSLPWPVTRWLWADLGGNHRGRRHRLPISFWEFTKYGLLVTAVTLLVAWPYVWGRFYAFH